MPDETPDASQQPQPQTPTPQPPAPPAEQDPPPPWASPAPPQWPAPGDQQPAPPPYQPPPPAWSYPPPAGPGAPPPAPPARPFGLTPRFIAAVVAAGLVVGVAVALPIALIGRSSQPSSTNTGGGTGSPSSTPAPGAATQARTLYQQALAATRASKGVHYVAVTSGAANQHTTGDAGQATGTQDITVTSTYGAEQFTLRLVDGVVYFQGNVPAAQDQVGLSPTEAARLTGKWITVVRGDGPYTVLQPGITTADQAAEMPLVATTVEQVSAGGKKVTRIRGTVPATADIPAGSAYMDVDPSTHLPVTYVSTVTAGKVTVTATTNFSKWGSAPSPSAPSGTVAWSTLNATEPPGGYGSGGGGQGTPAPA